MARWSEEASVSEAVTLAATWELLKNEQPTCKVTLRLDGSYFSLEMQDDVFGAILEAAEANQPNALKLLSEHGKKTSTPDRFLFMIDTTLVRSCKRGASLTAPILLGNGADVDESDTMPNSCLHLAAMHGDASTVKDTTRYGRIA